MFAAAFVALAASGALRVSAVTPGGPAGEAGIRKDDLLSAVQGAPSASLSRADAAAILRQPAGTAITLTGTFGGTPGSRTLTLRDLIRR